MEVTATGTPGVTFPSLATPVQTCCLSTIADDGAGGWFTAQFGQLIHFRADGTADPAISVAVSGCIDTLVRDGDVLYFGGSFAAANGVSRHSAVAIDALTPPNITIAAASKPRSRSPGPSRRPSRSSSRTSCRSMVAIGSTTPSKFGR